MIKKIATKIRYPKLYLLLISIFLGILIYRDENNFHFHTILDQLGYLGTFLAGMFFVYGFTVGPAVAMLFLAAQKQNFLLAGIAGSAGAFAGSFIVFQALKISYEEEVQRLIQNPLFKVFLSFFEKYFPNFARKYFLPILLEFSLPLPYQMNLLPLWSMLPEEFPCQFFLLWLSFLILLVFLFFLAIGRILERY